MKKFCSYILIVLLLSACTASRYSPEIERALTLAGENREELEQVLEHYSCDAVDSLKLRAAEFLIGNMPGKYAEVYDVAWKDMATGLYRWERALDKEKLMQTYGWTEPERRDDVKHITATYLIDNIELAFRVR